MNGLTVRIELDLQPADDADANEIGPREARLFVQIVEDVIQVPAGQHLVGFENRKVILYEFHGDVRNQKVSGEGRAERVVTQRRVVQANRIAIAAVVTIMQGCPGVGVTQFAQQIHDDPKPVRNFLVGIVAFLQQGGDCLRGAWLETHARAQVDGGRNECREILERMSLPEIAIHPVIKHHPVLGQDSIGALADIDLFYLRREQIGLEDGLHALLQTLLYPIDPGVDLEPFAPGCLETFELPAEQRDLQEMPDHHRLHFRPQGRVQNRATGNV